MDLIVPLLFFNKYGFGIESPTKVDMPLNKETKPNQTKPNQTKPMKCRNVFTQLKREFFLESNFILRRGSRDLRNIVLNLFMTMCNRMFVL